MKKIAVTWQPLPLLQQQLLPIAAELTPMGATQNTRLAYITAIDLGRHARVS